MPLDFSTVPAETRQQMLNEGLITRDNELTGLGTLSANLAGTNLQNAQKQAIVSQFNQGFINPDFSFTETGRLQFMDKDTALFEGKDTFRKWHRQGGWERYKNDKPNDPLHVAVGKAVDAIVTETLPQAAAGAAVVAASNLNLGKLYGWVADQPWASGLVAVFPSLGASVINRKVQEAAGQPVPTGQELQDQLDKMAAVAGGGFLKGLAQNQALMDKGAKLVWAKWGTDMTQDDTEEIDALYEFEKAQYLLNEIDAAEAVAAATALAHVVDPDDPASQEQMLEATQRARAGVELAASELTPEAAEFAEKAGVSAGEIFDPSLMAPTFGSFGVRGIIAGAGRSTAKRITKIADDIAEKKVLRETAQNALANANATEILGRAGVDRAALRKSVQELTTEIDELNNLAAKLTDRGYRGGVGRRALDTVGDATAASAKWVSGTWAGGVGRAIDNYFTAPRTLPGHARNLAIAGTAAGAAVSAEQLAAASGVPGLQLGSNIAKGVAALALAPHLYRNAKTLARTTHALGAEFVARRSTLPYWRGVSKRMADNKLISGAAVTMDMFAKPLVPVRNVGKRAAQATLAEMPFSYIASGGQDGWFAEAIAEGLIFGAPGQVQGLIHSMGGMPAVMKKEYFDQLANNDAAELRRTLPKRHRQALDNFRPEIRRMIGSYSAMFPDLEFRFQPAPGDLSGSGYDKNTNTVYIDPNTRRPLDALLAHEVAHSIQERGLDADIIDDLVGPNGLLRNEDGSLVEDARKFKAQYEKDLGRPISDETLAREWFAESAAPGLMRRQSLQKLVRRNPITRRLAESILPETSLGRQLLLRNGVLLDRNGRPVKGQGAMGAIVEGSPAMARIVDRYLRATAGDLPAADRTKAVEKAKERPLTPEEQENANRNNLIDFETNADGSQKKVNGRRIPVQPKTLKLQRITIGEEIKAFADELTFADAARMPEKLSLDEKINRFNEQDWEKLVDRLESAGIYNSSQIAMFREIFRRRAIGDSLSLKVNYQPAITTRNNRKKYDSRERELITGAVYQIRVTKAKNVVLDIIDMDFLQQRAMKAAQTKLGQELYPAGTAAIMRDVMTLAENHVNKDPNSAVFTKPNQLNFLNGVLGRLSMEHKAKNPMASGRPAVRSLRLDRINQIAPTQQKGLPFIPERWRDNLMPEPADERFFGETEPVVSMENMPGMNTGVLQNLHAASPAQRQDFEESILETIADPEFGDAFGRAIDTKVKLAPLAPSVYVNTEGGIEINAAQQVGGFRSREDAELYALLRGLFMKQEAVAGNLPNPGGEMTAADFFVGTALDEAGVKKVMTGIINALDEAGLGPAAAEDFAFYGNPEGFSLVHLGFNEAVTPQIRTDVFADQVELLGTPNYKEYASDTFYLDNNWKTTDVVTDYGEVKRASPSGEAYAAEIAARSRSTGRPDLLAGLADRVGARLQGVYDSFAAREFGEPGRQLGGPGTEGFTLTGRPLSEVQRAPEGDIRRMPEQLDADHRAAVEAGDLEAAQRMVDDAAVKAGGIALLHGSFGHKDIAKEGFYEGSGGAAYFVTEKDRKYAEGYGPVKPYYFFPKNKIADLRKKTNSAELQLLIKEFNSRGAWDAGRPWVDKPQLFDPDVDSTWMLFDDPRNEAADILRTGEYDAVILDEGEGVDSYAIMNLKTVKSADPVTYDDQNNLIPLSERFGPSDDIRRMPEQLDADYLAAVEAGDMDAAQELVSQAAVEAGFDPTVLYHGVRSEKPFTTFAGTQDPDGYGTYVTTDESYAHSFTGLKDGTPFSDPEFKKIFPNQEMLRLYAKPGRTKITDGENQDQFIEFTDQRTKNRSLTDQGYDSEKLQFADGHFDLRLTNNNQIASADPVIYDDQGNVIPLSERFNPESDDIRRMPEGNSNVIRLTGFGPGRSAATTAKLDAALADIEKLGDRNPNEPNLIVTPSGVQIGFSKLAKSPYLYWETVISTGERRKGHTSAVIKELQGIADKHGVGIEGQPAAFDSKGRGKKGVGKDGQLSQRELQRFYKARGFVPHPTKKGWILYEPEAEKVSPSDDIRRMPERLDADHRAAVEAGDTQTAQAMVDQAARAAGGIKLFHGSESHPQIMADKGFELGRAGAVYFTPEKDKILSEDYGPVKPYYFFPTKKVADLTADTPEFRKLVKEFNDAGGYEGADWLEEGETPLYDPNRDKSWELFDDPETDASDFLREGDYDAVILEEYRGESYAVLDPSKIKSADPATYDEQGNLIPLSERFDPKSDDIRRMPEAPTALPIVEARNKDGSVKKKDNKVVYETVDYDLLHAPALEQEAPPPQDTTKPDYDSLHYHVTKKDRERIDELIDSGAVDAAAADLEADAMQAMDIPEIASGIGWYSRMRKKLRIALAGDHELFADLLGATSANTDVEQNFIYAFDAYRQFKAGKFDKMLRRFQEAVDLADSGKLKDTMIARRIIGKGQAKRMDQQALLKKWIERYNLEPRRADGAKYGMNSAHVFRALSGQFTQVRGLRAKDKLSPKTPQFSMNLFGSSLSATIDVWAARYLRRRLYSGQVKQWRIQPKSETGVSNADFLLGQEIFRRAADKLGMSPDDLQALMWFKEKDVWDQARWTKGAGAIKTSFDQAADAFFPPGQKMSASQLAQANRRGLSSLNFIRKHRAVENAATKLEALAGQTGRKVTTAKRNLRNARKELTKARKRAGVAEFLERNPELN